MKSAELYLYLRSPLTLKPFIRWQQRADFCFSYFFPPLSLCLSIYKKSLSDSQSLENSSWKAHKMSAVEFSITVREYYGRLRYFALWRKYWVGQPAHIRRRPENRNTERIRYILYDVMSDKRRSKNITFKWNVVCVRRWYETEFFVVVRGFV